MSAVLRAARELLGIRLKKFGSRLIVPLAQDPSVMNGGWSQGDFIRGELWWKVRKRYKHQRKHRPTHASGLGKANHNSHLPLMPRLAKWTLFRGGMRAGVQQSPESVLGGRLINRPVGPI